ncbi:MAG: hypothetical protein JWL59_135 [Chthoniobacteraceae bacterium]|nr:hypothetical protein [Chthoniobacteraceae bacterium]
MPLRITVIAEAAADFQHVTELIDRSVREQAPDWWDGEQIDEAREYCGIQPETEFTRWRDLRHLSAGRGMLRNGGILDMNQPQRLGFDYASGRKALILCANAQPRPDVVLLVRDMDQQPKERKQSLGAARDDIPAAAMRVLLALPSAKREAWALAGWEPGSDLEHAAFAAVRMGLAFNPCEHSQQLDAMEHGAVRDAKRVLGILTGEDPEREAKCWRETAWETLEARGSQNGLADFLNELNALVPLIIGA